METKDRKGTSKIKGYGLFAVAFFFMAVHAVSAQQERKKKYDGALDSLWSKTTYIDKLSGDGKWVVLIEEFDKKENSTHLRHTSDTLSYDLGNCQWVSFSGNSRWFGCISADGVFNLIDLERRTRTYYPGAESYGFSNAGEYVAVLRKAGGADGTLEVMGLPGKTATDIADVSGYTWNPQANELLLALHGEGGPKVVLYDAGTSRFTDVHKGSAGNFMHLAWNALGTACIFFEQKEQGSLLHHRKSNGVRSQLDDRALQEKFPLCRISDRAPHVSHDGKKVLFYRQVLGQGSRDGQGKMEAWATEDAWIAPKLRSYEENELRYLLTAWYPETNTLLAVETSERPTAAHDVDHDYALVFNTLQYEPLYKQFTNADLYARDVRTGAEHLVVQNQYTGSGYVTVSPKGRFIAYFRDNDWLVYDCRKKTTANLTRDMGTRFDNFERDYTGDPFPFGNPGWSSDEQYILLYDQYDIWKVSPDGRRRERMTKGREEKITYRIDKDHRRNNFFFLTVNANFSSSPFDLEKELLLEINDGRRHWTGYAIWHPGKKVSRLMLEDAKIDEVLVSKDFRCIVYRRQQFDAPPAIYRLEPRGNRKHLVYQGNRDLLDYDLGKGVLIEYKVDGKDHSGALLYPAHFNPDRKYPLIVYIYERLSGQLHYFAAPSDYDPVGFNALKYTTNDYFVLYPDISYTPQQPGMSALKSVTAAVGKVLESGFVDRDRMGLMGHSFGGYESAFICTQTDLFAAVVAGAAVTDVTSHYHSIGWNWNQPEIWRYEAQQWRMGSSYHENKELYLQNSPLHHMEKVTKPLLLWTGKEDHQVYWQQSIEMFTGLKRMGKEGRLLLFEKEGHSIRDKENQWRLSTEVRKWFDKYCK